jgi:phage head maturation protease
MTAERFTRSISFVEFEVREDGRDIEGLIAPYEAPAEVNDGEGFYLEVFARDSFDGMFQAFDARKDYKRVRLNLDHRSDFDHEVGFATLIADSTDGVVGSFRLWAGSDLDKVRSMLTESHTGLSVEFGARARRVRPDGTIERRGANIYAVAATPTPAYPGAGILAMRDGDPAETVGPTPLLDGMLERWGLEHLRSAVDTAELAPDSAAPDSAAPSI